MTDVTALSGTGKDAAFTRPMFQGKLAAQVKPLGEPPFFITVQIGAFRADAVRKGGNAPVTPVTVSIAILVMPSASCAIWKVRSSHTL